MVQRSANGLRFQDLATVNSKAVNGSSSTDLDYIFTDARPEPGANYYRLQQVDLNGKTDLSNIVAIDNTSIARLTAYPSPVKGQVFLKGLPVSTSTSYSITNSVGQILLRGKLINNTINVSALQPGMYYLNAANQSVRFMKD